LTGWPKSRLQQRLGVAPTLSNNTPNGRVVTLRTPRFSDADEWRRTRLADQSAIEPFWDHSELSWSARHSRRAWIRECIDARRRMRRGDCVHTVIEVDGQLAGQCDAWLEQYHGRGELGLWVHSQWAGTGAATTAVSLLIDYLFAEIGLERIVAPIACGNEAPARIAQRLGFVHEGVLRSYMNVGGTRRDHDLWSQTREDWLAASGARTRRSAMRDHEKRPTPSRQAGER
jgi:RimJ/RimL family protein N-acetyltransferase